MTSVEEASGSLECPTMIKSSQREPVMAIIEMLAATECRFRSIVSFDIGECVEFDLALHGAPRVVIRGRITSRAHNGPRTICTLSIDASASDVPEDLLEVERMAQRQARTRSADPPSENGLTRSNARADVSMDVSYSINGGANQRAEATNVSVGGMFIRAAQELRVGVSLDVAFALPQSREPSRAKARIVAMQSDGSQWRYNLAFYSLDPATVRAIAAYVTSAGS